MARRKFMQRTNKSTSGCDVRHTAATNTTVEQVYNDNVQVCHFDEPEQAGRYILAHDPPEGRVWVVYDGFRNRWMPSGQMKWYAAAALLPQVRDTLARSGNLQLAHAVSTLLEDEVSPLEHELKGVEERKEQDLDNARRRQIGYQAGSAARDQGPTWKDNPYDAMSPEFAGYEVGWHESCEHYGPNGGAS